jgi:hypothetical protein
VGSAASVHLLCCSETRAEISVDEKWNWGKGPSNASKKRSSFQLIYAGAPYKSGKTSPVCHAPQVLEKIEDEIWAAGEQPCEMLFIVFLLKSCSDLCEHTTNSLVLTQ